ncbi:MAG: HNH endonuclease [Blastocatellia bacterium]|nr:HNH endonuclease [Blastocatellia bacterium]
MSKVFVLDTNRKPLEPCHPAVARKLLSAGKAAVLRRFPFVILLKRAVEKPNPQPLRLKLDPGSKVSGLAVVNDTTGEVVFAAEIEHRGKHIKAALDARRVVRRNRRNRKTRYRKPRFLNRTRKAGWLPPSLESRVANLVTWVARLIRWCPLTALSQELVRFDLHMLQNPEISGIEYQQGTLAGSEVKEYLLEKFGRHCVYCGQAGVPLQVEHIVPRAQGGTNRVSNLTLACGPCNQAKGNRTAAEFGFPQVQALAQAPLRDAAAVNTTRWALLERLKRFGLPVETGSGGLTKFNRGQQGIEKGHWQDACCVGTSTPATLLISGITPFRITATGHGHRQMCGVNECGIATRHRTRCKLHFGFQTGDLTRAVVTRGKKAGTYVGRVLARASGSFDIRTARQRVAGIQARFCVPIHRNDGYRYHFS